MQLKKYHTKRAPTFDPVSHPRGTKRFSHDFDQTRNLARCVKQPKSTVPNKRELPHTPRELFALNCSRLQNGYMPTLAQHNVIDPAHALLEPVGMNW